MVAENRGSSLAVVRRLLLEVASLAVSAGTQWLTACGIFLDQGSDLYLLHWQADSYPLSQQGSPLPFSYKDTYWI